MFDQIRTDHGKEFVLLQFVQESLAHLRRNVNIDPHRQKQSKHVSKSVSNIYNVYRGGSRLVQTMLMHRSENCKSSNINMSRPIAKTTKGYIQTLDHSLQKYHLMNKRSCWAKIRSKKYITAASSMYVNVVLIIFRC